jgi:acetoin utilization deacetylase AcuC-like enzyme
VAVREPRIHAFYREEMAIGGRATLTGSQSPEKPRLFLDYLARHGLLDALQIRADFDPLDRAEFLLAHTPRYVDAFFAGEPPLCQSSRLPWSPELVQSVRWTNASLLHALRAACLDPARIALSPTSGFHHARPDAGSAYCTFSGQVIASVRVYRELGARGAWLDLDGHLGNSIEDARSFVPDLSLAVPPGCNVNPDGRHGAYLRQLERALASIEGRLLGGELTYVAFAHGADSHEWDDNGYQLSTDEWVASAEMVYRWVARCSSVLGRPVPLLLALFGGYRSDHYDSVLALHAADLVTCLNVLCGAAISFHPEVRPPPRV